MDFFVNLGSNNQNSATDEGQTIAQEVGWLGTKTIINKNIVTAVISFQQWRSRRHFFLGGGAKSQ